MFRAACLFLCLSAAGAHALDLPGTASETARRRVPFTAQSFPTGPFEGDETARLTLEGDVLHVAYRLPATALTSLQMLSLLRAQLAEEGFDIRFTCADRDCGGFDFRYLLDLLPEPGMHVDLGDFRYLLAVHDEGRAVAVLTSRAPQTGYIQITTVTPAETPEIALRPVDGGQGTGAGASAPTDIAAALAARGRVALDDLSFETGAAALGPGPFSSLVRLAGWLADHPTAHVVLVGHTDTVGSLSGNTALSRQRAEAVRARLVTVHGVDPAQIEAQGVGFLAPRASNATEEGRERNRRVEAVLSSPP
ncbi:OmpA family protein [Celeribacter indicus]|uniref:OmpA/MotB domain-containing protein n=1 Tax=Celeribacter indicus TaxID=1208324 RepID=A0A0B5DYI7_9RHOB|nr:OmpA family protein [Celeribacter indicus]AJE45262.1 OmpA/MotB domain-containing protein [Celeribacter indicus]SDX21284.1 Outer membrane protein OmpA [Celeribacter indicus]